MPLRVLHIITSLGKGGAEVLLSNTIPLLREFEQHLVTFQAPIDQLNDLSPFLTSYRCLHIERRSQWIKGIFNLRKVINAIEPDLIHVHLFTPALLTKIAAPKKIPLFYSIHNTYSIDAFKANPWALLFERLTASRSHHLIGVSELVLRDYQSHVKNSGTGDVIYNMVGNEFFNDHIREDYSPYTPLRCISVGRLKLQKNYPFTLQAFKLLKDVPITLDIYGDGPEKENLEKIILKDELSNVRLMGQSTEMEKVLKNYDLYEISSTYEGFGIALLEALATGIPSLASDIPVFREAACDAVIYFGLEQPVDLAQSLRAIYEGKLSLLDYSTLGKKQAVYIASSEKYIKSLKSLYKKYS